MNHPDNLTAHDWQHIEGTTMQDETPTISTQGVVSAGNWSVEEPGILLGGVPQVPWCVNDAEGEPVCAVLRNDDAASIARLIAAAPDLLALVERAHYFAVAVGMAYAPHSPAASMRLREALDTTKAKLIVDTKAAIAKALGA